MFRFSRMLVVVCTLGFAFVAGKAQAQGGACRDPWINQAFNQIFHRAPQGSGQGGECDIRLYGGGSWSGYPDLYNKVMGSKYCQDPWIGEAYLLTVHRQPTAAECTVTNYGGGHWTSFGDLVTKVQQYQSQRSVAAPVATPPPAPVANNSGPCRDPWVSQAVRQVRSRSAYGSGDVGECNPALYGAQWSSYQQLVGQVQQSSQALDQAGLQYLPDGRLHDLRFNQIFTGPGWVGPASQAPGMNWHIQLARGYVLAVQRNCPPNESPAPGGGCIAPNGGNGSPAPYQPHPVAPVPPTPAPSNPGPCRDPWVSQAIREVMDRPANGSADVGECNFRNYGGGSWSGYADLKQKVITYFNGTCRDPWVTQAVSEVRGRRPQGYGDVGECNYRNYGGGSWSSYTDLKQKVQAAFGVPNAAPPITAPSRPAPAPSVSGNAGSNPAIMSMIEAGYQRDFGRAATQAELGYWASVPASDPRLRSPAAFQQNNLNYLRGSAPERQRIIEQAFAQIWNVNLSAASPEFKFWDGALSSGQANYTALLRADQALRSSNPSYRPGMNPPMAFTVPSGGGYSLKSTDGTEAPDPITLLADEFKVVQQFFTIVTGHMPTPTPPPGPLATPSPRGSANPPQVITPPNRGLAGPYVIAATPDTQPTLSFCLDTGSWNAGSQVVAARCHGRASQLFDIDAQNRIYMTNNPQGRLCLDGSNLTMRGAALTLQPCNNSRSQQWYVNTIPGLHAGDPWTDNFEVDHIIDQAHKSDAWNQAISYSGGQIQNMGNNFCIDIRGAAMNPNIGNPVIMWDCQTSAVGRARPWNQIWGAGHVMTNGAAYVFFRYSPPFNLGHTTWAIELPDGTWEAGGEDGINFPMTNKGTWNGTFRKHFPDEQSLRNWFATGGGGFSPYDRYLRFDVPLADSAAAFSLESQAWDWGYGVLGNNCVDETLKVLRAYGVSTSSLPNITAQSPIPQVWFQGLPGGNNAYYLHR